MNCGYIITNHARERFVERFSKNYKQYAHLEKCCKDSCSDCRALVFKLSEDIKQNCHSINELMRLKLSEAKETRIHHMNSRFMETMQRKYGDKRFHFLLYENVLFVTIDNEEEGNAPIVVTCFDARYSVIGDFVRRPKFRKKEKIV